MCSPPVDLLHTTLSDLAKGLRSNTFTSRQLVKTYIARILEVNSEFHAITELNPSALDDAQTLDLKRHLRQKSYGPLHGLPILLKDNIPTLDGTDTTAGSFALVGARPPREASVVTSLRDAGAIVLGKANMAEWSGFRSTSGCSGWSASGGQGTGVFYKGMKASGSSVGCAISVALGLCAAAVGTETCYSIVSPAERSGIVGYKPTRGVVSSKGIIHASRRLDTVGVLTRSVEDAAIMLRELLKYSKHHSRQSKRHLYKAFDPANLTTSLKGIRVGIPWHIPDLQSLPPAKQHAFKSALAVLRNAGATFAHDIVITGVETYLSQTRAEREIVLNTEMKESINNYLASLVTNPNNITSLTELISFTKTCPEEEYPARNVERLERTDNTDVNSMKYQAQRLKDMRFKNEDGIQGALKRCRCDVLVVPTLSVVLQTFAAMAGSPVVSVPIGKYPASTKVVVDERSGLVDVAPGVPISAYVFGMAGKDMDVLRVAAVLERGLRIREGLVPYLEPETQLGDVVRDG